MDGVVLSVSDFIALTNQTLEYAYPTVVVEGEVSSFKTNRDKYVFFDLKDDTGSVSCFMMLFQLKVALEDGMKIQIVARPKLTDWGKFSLTVTDIKLIGEGALLKSFELLKAKLAKEGLFAEERKRLLPEFPERIGVISSMQAAGYEDFLKVVSARWGGLDIQVADVRVQGERSAEQIVAAIDHFNQLSQPVDVVVLVRGGGSLDDLQSFSTETVARAVAASRQPILVGVGHEQDITLADLAADVRAATPSNAAEIVVPDREEQARSLNLNINHLEQRLLGYQRADFELIDSGLGAFARYLTVTVDAQKTTLDYDVNSLHQRLVHQTTQISAKVDNLFAQLQASDPRKLMKRGYSLVRDGSGKLIKSVKGVKSGDKLVLELSDGKLKTEVTDA